MSLMQPPTQVFSAPEASSNPFGPKAVLGADDLVPSPKEISAPQARAPFATSDLQPASAPSSRTDSRPDFSRGFGLDIPEEEEEEADDEGAGEQEQPEEEDSFITNTDEDIEDGLTTAAQSRMHSRHVSRLSAALSLRSVGGVSGELGRSAAENAVALNETDAEAVDEWTGSEVEPPMAGEISDDEVR